ncbi:hypothetical protein CC85DRAFT_299622 [Cutaneotrichosporon oleaginosum]|uniref:Uncharacterized protein n=1 Tax=Cutaneotrichosporon oleaginosum TaxID=879819 RepID=A0A0J1BC21_9TREE|nr:uncharacterized protein CC85DRAFT_299622 [Cutaneotrichosporon oleaginosum]KLT45564.1 hypothetical protein CC85DRAFT_299622 [Cutaneotrichosporon oleaginosum]TXT14483.1 hypothetical protein COLE_00676 [Cutaneotrichosporon oleaginosum]
MLSPLDYSAHPHIVERIIALSDTHALLPLRHLNRALKRTIDRSLCNHLIVSQPEAGRWLEWHVSSPSSTPLRLPTSHARRVAAQIVDPALLLQRSFSGMLFRLAPGDVSWLESTLAYTHTVSIRGDIWYGNRTLPFGALSSVFARAVPRLRLLPAPTGAYPSLHPFTARCVEVCAEIRADTRCDRAWVGTGTLLPPGVEDLRIQLRVERQDWAGERARPLVYPLSVRRVRVDLDVAPGEAVRVVGDKLFRHFRADIAWTVTGLDAGIVLALVAAASSAETKEVRAAMSFGASGT